MFHAADGVLLLDKPAGVTSTRALAMAKRSLQAAKGGHTGTLDPFATGLLPLAFGEATKFSQYVIDSAKAYEATLELGSESETGDTESAPRRVSTELPEKARIDAVLSGFVGDQWQMPPMHSAVHIAGRRLYEYARRGEEVPRAARQVQIRDLRVLRHAGPELVVAVVCSKGTYIRVLAADIGRALGCGAYLTALRRTAVGPFDLAMAVGLEELAAEGPDRARGRLLPPEVLVQGLEKVHLEREAAVRLGHGQELDAPDPRLAGPVAVFGPGARFLGVAALREGRMAPLRLLAGEPKFPDFA